MVLSFHLTSLKINPTKRILWLGRSSYSAYHPQRSIPEWNHATRPEGLERLKLERSTRPLNDRDDRVPVEHNLSTRYPAPYLRKNVSHVAGRRKVSFTRRPLSGSRGQAQHQTRVANTHETSILRSKNDVNTDDYSVSKQRQQRPFNSFPQSSDDMNATSPLIHHDALLEINAKNIEALHDDVATAAKPAQPVTARPRPHGSEPWQVQKAALTGKLSGAPWKPRKRLSPDAMDGIRALHEQYPEEFTTTVLAKRFEISPEAIRRILRSKWQPSEEEDEDRRLRWSKRGESIWQKNAELGIKPPKKWRDLGITRHLNDHAGPI